MNRIALLSLMENLRIRGNWCNELCLHRITFFTKMLAKVPINLDFILYKHGPFSSKLRYELSSMRAERLIKLKIIYPYPPKIQVTDSGNSFLNSNEATLSKYEKRISFIANELCEYEGYNLDAISIIYFLELESGLSEVKSLIVKVLERKPYIKSPALIKMLIGQLRVIQARYEDLFEE